MNDYLTIPASTMPVKYHADICVIGGSCTGVFAAVRAARLGKKVVLLERSGKFGGVATLGLVNIWHSLYDYMGKEQIIGGLTWEILERLEKYGAVSDFRDREYVKIHGIKLNTEELTLELDALVAAEKNIQVCFHTDYEMPILSGDGKRVQAIVALDKNGRFGIQAEYYVDATGDGLLCRDAGVPMWTAEAPQPPTSCCHLENWQKLQLHRLKELFEKYRADIPGLPCGYAWSSTIPGSSRLMLAGTRVLNCHCENAEDITRAEMEARSQIRAMLDMFRREYPDACLSLSGLPSAIGIREGLHIHSIGQATGLDLLHNGVPKEKTVGCATYPVDIHCPWNDQIEFYQLDGRHVVWRSQSIVKEERWLPEGEYLPFYRIPLKALIPEKLENVIAAGRMIDADSMAFGALRVMVNLNQCGEAAGTAAVLCLEDNHGSVQNIDCSRLRKILRQGGSILA